MPPRPSALNTVMTSGVWNISPGSRCQLKLLGSMPARTLGQPRVSTSVSMEKLPL